MEKQRKKKCTSQQSRRAWNMVDLSVALSSKYIPHWRKAENEPLRDAERPLFAFEKSLCDLVSIIRLLVAVQKSYLLLGQVTAVLRVICRLLPKQRGKSRDCCVRIAISYLVVSSLELISGIWKLKNVKNNRTGKFSMFLQTFLFFFWKPWKK